MACHATCNGAEIGQPGGEMADDPNLYASVDAKQAQLDATDARNLAKTALFASLVAVIIALVALLWR